jgi:hypothetical protein
VPRNQPQRQHFHGIAPSKNIREIPAPQPAVKILGWHKLVCGTMRGFVDIEIEVGESRRPPKSSSASSTLAIPLGSASPPKRKSISIGKPEYAALLKWRRPDDRAQFSRRDQAAAHPPPRRS